MRVRRTLPCPIVLLALGLWAAAPLEGAQFQVAVGSETKTAGTRITIPIVVTAEVTVGAAQLELLYDPNRLRWVSGDAGSLTANTLVDANLVEPGRVRIAFAGGDEVRGTGEIYRATFEWTASDPGGTTLRLAGVRAWDQVTGLELATSASPGEAVPILATAAEPRAPEIAKSPSSKTSYLPYVVVATVMFFLIAAAAVVLRRAGSSHGPNLKRTRL